MADKEAKQEQAPEAKEAPKTTPKAEEKQEAPQKEAPKAAPKKTPKPASGILVFNKWDVSAVEVQDQGLQKYVTLTPRIVPKTGARYAGNRFHKSRVFIIERLINKLMVVGHKGKKHKASSGHNTGRVQNTYAIVERALTIIEQKTKKNPIAVFVQALENAAPREEIINIEYGGARYPKAVECAPQRRIDIALRQFAQGAYHKGFDKSTDAAAVLADEILAAASLNQQSVAIQKKVDLERTADSSR